MQRPPPPTVVLVQPSSFVFVAIVALWAAYLLPQWIRRRDALGAARGSDRHSLALRVLERRRRRPPGPSSAPLLATRAPSVRPDTARRPPVDMPEHRTSTMPALVPAQGMTAPSARVAARRRASVLAALLTLTVLATAGAVAGVVSGGVLMMATTFLAADLAALRLVARRARRSRPDAARLATAGSAASRARGAGLTLPVATTAAPSPAPAERAVPDAEPQAGAALSRPADDGTWVPVPVPPPTYTLKPVAPRAAPAPLETLAPPAGSAAPASGAALPATPPAWPAFAGVPPRPWVTDEPADVDLDSVLQRRRAVNG
jgi:hypothetical protein